MLVAAHVCAEDLLIGDRGVRHAEDAFPEDCQLFRRGGAMPRRHIDGPDLIGAGDIGQKGQATAIGPKAAAHGAATMQVSLKRIRHRFLLSSLPSGKGLG
jgi:hypothetical protein